MVNEHQNLEQIRLEIRQQMEALETTIGWLQQLIVEIHKDLPDEHRPQCLKDNIDTVLLGHAQRRTALKINTLKDLESQLRDIDDRIKGIIQLGGEPKLGLIETKACLDEKVVLVKHSDPMNTDLY